MKLSSTIRLNEILSFFPDDIKIIGLGVFVMWHYHLIWKPIPDRKRKQVLSEMNKMSIYLSVGSN